MANVIRIKRNTTGAPSPSALLHGELAINYNQADTVNGLKLFAENAAGAVFVINSATVTGSGANGFEIGPYQGLDVAGSGGVTVTSNAATGTITIDGAGSTSAASWNVKGDGLATENIAHGDTLSITGGCGVGVDTITDGVIISTVITANGGLTCLSGSLSLDLGASAIVGTLAVGDGGTGASSLTSNGVLVGNGTGAVTATAEGASDTVLMGNTGSDPSFGKITTAHIAAASLVGTGENLSSPGLDTELVTGRAIVDYVSTQIASAQASEMTYLGGYNAATNTPDLAAITSAKGDVYTVTAAGTFLGEAVEVGDMIIAEAAGVLSTAAEWTIVNKNLDNGIGNGQNVVVDSASVVAGEYAVFTANGVESKSAAEVVIDLNIQTNLSFTTDTVGTNLVDLGSDVMTFAGGEGMDVTHSGDTITISGEDATTTNKGIASFNSGDFSVASGAVSIVGLDVANFDATAIVTSIEPFTSSVLDTNIPTTDAVIAYVATQISAEDLDFAGESGTGAVDLDSQTMTITGAGSELSTTASGQTLTITANTGTGAGTLATGNHNHLLDSLSNVDTTGKAVDNLIKWDGTNWVDTDTIDGGTF